METVIRGIESRWDAIAMTKLQSRLKLGKAAIQVVRQVREVRVGEGGRGWGRAGEGGMEAATPPDADYDEDFQTGFG